VTEGWSSGAGCGWQCARAKAAVVAERSIPVMVEHHLRRGMGATPLACTMVIPTILGLVE
jgi:hypothetical protein